MKLNSFKCKSLLYIFLPLISICLIYMISNVFAQLNLSLQEAETEAQISNLVSFRFDPPVPYPLRLSRVNNVLIDPLGNHFNGLLPTCFLLCSPDRDWSFTKAYIDQRHQDGASGFRAIWNCCWGPMHQCEHGGNTIFWDNEPLKERTEQVLEYLKSKGMYLVLEILDSCLYIKIGEDYYAQNSDWLELFDYVVELNHEYPNLIVGTGNEPAKVPYDRKLIIDWQKWAVKQLKQKASNMGDELILAVEISNGVGVPELTLLDTNPDDWVYPLIDILGFKTSRLDAPSVIQITYNQLKRLSNLHPNKVIWGQEPPRRNYPYMGAWCSPMHKKWLRKIMFLHMGKLYTPHGLGHGEEEHKPFDWGGDGKFFWGIGNRDWPDMWNAFNMFVDTIKTIPDGRTYYNLYPDNSWFSGNGHGFSSPQPQRIFICMAYENEIFVNLPDLGFCRLLLFNPVTEQFVWDEYKQNGVFTVSNAKDKVIYVRKAYPGILTEAK